MISQILLVVTTNKGIAARMVSVKTLFELPKLNVAVLR